MALHKNLTYADGHVAHAYEYVDATARTGATGLVAGDVGKFARQVDEESFWVLTSHSPVTWLEIGGGGSGETGVAEAGYPRGVQDSSECSLSWDNATKALSLAVKSPATSFTVLEATDSSIETYEFTTTQTATISSPAPGWWWFWFDTGVLTTGQTLPAAGFRTALVALVYLDASNDAIAVLDERHGPTMTWRTHDYLHHTVGTRFENGFGLSRISSGTGTANGDAEIIVSGGIIWDEDIECNIERSATPTNLFEQELGESPSTQAEIPIYYRLGTSYWAKIAATSVPLHNISAGQRPAYNLLTAGSWSLAEISGNNDYAIMYICAVNGVGNADGAGYLTEPVIALMGQDDYASIDDARDTTFADMQLGIFFANELKPLYKLIYKCNSSYANDYKAYLLEFVDLRNVAPLPGVAFVASDHQSLTGRTSTGAHPASAVSVDSSVFSGNLTVDDDEVQKALVTIDDLDVSREDIQIPLIAGEGSTNLGVYTRLGACIFDKANFPATSYTLKIAAQSDDANSFSVQLYDVTAGAYITGTITDTTGDLAILSLASLTLGTGERLYELHAKLNAGSGADAFVRVSAAFIEVIR